MIVSLKVLHITAWSPHFENFSCVHKSALKSQSAHIRVSHKVWRKKCIYLGFVHTFKSHFYVSVDKRRLHVPEKVTSCNQHEKRWGGQGRTCRLHTHVFSFRCYTALHLQVRAVLFCSLKVSNLDFGIILLSVGCAIYNGCLRRVSAALRPSLTGSYFSNVMVRFVWRREED